MANQLMVVEQDAETQRRAEWERLQGAASSLIRRLEEEATERVRRRQPTERRWLDDLRQYHGLYDPRIEAILNADPERSKVFINITRPKSTSWAARLGDMLFPNDDKNWGIEPTPVPALTQSASDAVKQAEAAEAEARTLAEQHNQQMDAGATPEQTEALRTKAMEAASIAMQHRAKDAQIRMLQDEASRRCKSMEREIDDQLSEARYPSRARDIIDDAVKLGVGVLKGPLTSSNPTRRWTKQEDGSFVLDTRPDPRPDFRRVNPWHFFPDPDATEMQDCESTLERHILNRSALRRMAKRLEWNEETVNKIIASEPLATHDADFNWLTQLRTIEQDAENAVINRYTVWEYHGPLLKTEIINLLRASGRDEDAMAFNDDCCDDYEERMVICYFSQGRLLKLEEYFPLDRGSSLYSVFSFEKGEASVLGAVGVPNLMRHEQSMLNSAVRMMQDNAALSVGPQIVIDKTQVEPEDGSWKLAPRKIWKKKGQDISRDQKPFETFNIPMNQAQLAGIIELAIRFIDEVVSMPTIAQGEQGAHVTQTSSGMSMLFNSANVVFRRVVKNWDDDLTTPTINRAYDWNMQFSPKDEIKGDMQTVARGTSVLLVREVQSQQLMLIAQTWSTHPVMGPAIKVYQVMRMTLQTLSINPDQVLCDEEEFERRLKAMAESQAGQETPEAIRAKSAIDVANIDAQSRSEQVQVQKEIAQINQETEIYKLIQRDGVDMAKVQAMLEGKKIDTDSKERTFAAEAAIEARNAREARASGHEPTGSGGFISSGDGPA